MIGEPTDDVFKNTDHIFLWKFMIKVKKIANKVMVKNPIECCEHHYKWQGLKMTNSFSVNELSDSVSRPCHELLNGVKDAIVKMEKTML